MQTELQQFLKQVNEIYGLFLDSTTAFCNWHKELSQSQSNFQKQSQLSEAKFNASKYFYGKLQENKKVRPLGHFCTFGELLERNQKDGSNHKKIANFSIVLIFSYWEYYRNKLLERTNKTVDSDLMADIMYLRRAIIHNREIGDEDMKKCKVITRYKTDDKIEIDEDYFDEIIEKIKQEMIDIDKKYFT